MRSQHAERAIDDQLVAVGVGPARFLNEQGRRARSEPREDVVWTLPDAVVAEMNPRDDRIEFHPGRLRRESARAFAQPKRFRAAGRRALPWMPSKRSADAAASRVWAANSHADESSS